MPYDVLCNRSKNAFNAVGNRRFRVLVECHGAKYFAAKTKAEKTTIVMNIVKTVEKAGGRFISRTLGGEWETLTLIKKKEKVGHQLRAYITGIKSGKPRNIHDLLASEDMKSGANLASFASERSLSLTDALKATIQKSSAKKRNVTLDALIRNVEVLTWSNELEIYDEKKEDVMPTEHTMTDLVHSRNEVKQASHEANSTPDLVTRGGNSLDVDALFEMFKPETDEIESSAFETELDNTLALLNEIAQNDTLFDDF